MNSAIRKFVFLEEAGHNLSFAVSLVDDFSQQGFLLGETRVFLEDNGTEAIKNPSGYYIFLDLPDGNFQMRVENRYYFEMGTEVIISNLDPQLPVISEILIPNYIYPFPTGSTLIRGGIYDQNQDIPIPGASVQIQNTSISSVCDNFGRFVLYFGPLTEDDIDIQDSHRYIKIDNNTTLVLSIEHPDYNNKAETIGIIEEGKTKLLTEKIFLEPM